MGDFSNTALTGLDAASHELSVDSNNIANIKTLGYKASDANFYELYSGSGDIGSGVLPGQTRHLFGQGSSIQTGLSTDMMVDGEGFFTLRDSGSGQQYYTRAGDFTLNSDGYLVNSQGYRVQGYQGTSQSGFLSDLQINQAPIAPSASENVAFTGNLNSQVNDGATQSVTFYDASGASHILAVQFSYNSGTSAWDLTYKVDGVAKTQTPAQSIAFNSAGQITSGQAQTVDTGIGNLAFDYSAMTNYGGSSLTGPIGNADGYTAGNYSGFVVQKGGVIVENYTNGKTKQVGSIALSKFFVNGELKNAGNNNWTAGSGVGQITTGISGSSGLGSISSGRLEGSNVDLSEQVVDMISAQRDFQSDAQVLKTGKLLDQTVLNINQ